MENVSLLYQTPESETEALKDVNLSVEEGEFVAIIGPSGCGKTTILSLIAGLLKPTSGSISIGGKRVEKPSGEIGYMLQRDHLFPWRTILKNTLLGLELQKKKTPENVAYAESLIEKYGLGEFKKAYPRQLSGGMRQRAALIRTLAYRPKILLLDEPFSALDQQTRLRVCDDVHGIIKSEQKTAVLVTHDIYEAISLADRIVVLSKRPATIKTIYSPGISGTPLERRDDEAFMRWFDTIYKDVSS
ncbi:MAG: ABC transporter ATP-binding protein [Clostridiales bacterium]|nr:ABC transporter ATP-binding protein [Clostridiales bacterium]